MIDYELKLMHDEDNILSFFAIRQNCKEYPREENNLGDDYSMYLTNDCHMCDTVIS